MILKIATLTGLLLAAWCIAARPADAQRGGENPVTEAEDAFGTNIGGESIGLYHSGNVRGFSPLAAGNVRLEGLYFDRQGEFTSRLVAGSTIRVGLSALGYPFSAPTGVVDYRLRKPGDAQVTSTVVQVNSFGGTQLEVDAQGPIGSGRVGIAAGLGLYGNEYPDGGDAFVSSAAITSRWQPRDGVEVLPFWSRIDIHDRKVAPAILVGADHLPPVIARRHFFGQPWAGFDAVRTNYGAIGKVASGAWTLRGGLFRSVEEPSRSFATLFLNTTAEGLADLVVVANPPQYFGSTSGEVRLSRELAAGSLRHMLHLSVRGREQARRYGGAHRLELGQARIGETAAVPAPAIEFHERTRDDIRQWTGSVAYEGRWTKIVELSLGLQHTNYSKSVSDPAGSLPTTREAAWLPNATVAVHAARSLVLHVGFARGLEESPVAPETATNRDEAPPAIRTEQVDVGLRWQPVRGVRLVAGAFQVEKPYHALDTARVFRQLGQVRHRGLELSLSGEPVPGLSVVAGAIPMDAAVRGEQVEEGRIGDRPVGSAKSRIIGNLDYRPPALAALSVDLAVERSGSRIGNLANTVRVPAVTVVDVGARYRFAMGRAGAVLRVSASNLFDAFTWNVAGGGAFSYNPSRQVTARVTIDF